MSVLSRPSWGSADSIRMKRSFSNALGSPGLRRMMTSVRRSTKSDHPSFKLVKSFHDAPSLVLGNVPVRCTQNPRALSIVTLISHPRNSETMRSVLINNQLGYHLHECLGSHSQHLCSAPAQSATFFMASPHCTIKLRTIRAYMNWVWVR